MVRPTAGTALWILAALLPCRTHCQLDGQPSSSHMHIEKQRYDGWYNNLAHQDWGAVESQLVRKAPSSYADGVYMIPEGRPSARSLSQELFKGEDGLPSTRNITVLFVFFGQVISSEILMASEPGCPIEFHRIPISRCDEMYDSKCTGERYMPFHRAHYDVKTGQSPNNPREQTNLATSWIDASYVYSTSETWANTMRSFENGTFRVAEARLPPKNKERVPLFNSPPARYLGVMNPERMFILGDPRTNQNPGLLAFGILFFRYHNVHALRIKSQHPDWSDEDIFLHARRHVIATLQNVIMYEYVPVLLGENVTEYTGYKPDVHPGISHEFQAAAFRFPHTSIPPGIYRRDGSCHFLDTKNGFKALRLCSTWWLSEEILPSSGIDELILGMASQIAEKEDHILCSDVRDKLFGPVEFTRRDLAALDIMRGRDNGLPDYNTVRRHLGLPPATSWTQINEKLAHTNPELFEKLRKLYRDQLDNIDLFVGGMLESDEGRPGPLFRKIIREQFERLRDADRFWFENQHNGMFSAKEIEEIRKIRMYDIIVEATDIKPHEIQKEVFFHFKGDPCPQPQQINSSILEPCMILDGWDYFRGNEVAYIYSCLVLAFIPIICAGLGYGVIKLQNRRRRNIKAKKEMTIGKNYDKLCEPKALLLL